MKLNHLAICARDVAASQAFYCSYFGFRQGPGPGLLASEDGFGLAIHEVQTLPALPACVHFGFFLATRALALELCERMRREGVVIAEEPSEHLGDLLFFCRDPAGFLVEVRGLADDETSLPPAAR
jgi:catechol 2,3-dioxygenase-like lactoylglutathione lyase family enzyme